MKGKIKGLLLCFVIAVPAWLLGRKFAVVGGPVISILLGMIVGMFLKNRAPFDAGIKFTSKKILQWAVILLGFGMNLTVIGQTGVQSLPIILSTITTSLLVAFILCKALKIPSKISTLVGVGSSICGGSAIAATAPVIDASDEEVAQAISVIFFYNVIAALVFPLMGTLLGFSTTSGEAFGIFAGTAVNDTSSVTAAASTWDSMWGLGSQTLDKAVTVKLTRTLAIIPITLVLALIRSKKSAGEAGKKVSLKSVFPMFILYFELYRRGARRDRRNADAGRPCAHFDCASVRDRRGALRFGGNQRGRRGQRGRKRVRAAQGAEQVHDYPRHGRGRA